MYTISRNSDGSSKKDEVPVTGGGWETVVVDMAGADGVRSLFAVVIWAIDIVRAEKLSTSVTDMAESDNVRCI